MVVVEEFVVRVFKGGKVAVPKRLRELFGVEDSDYVRLALLEVMKKKKQVFLRVVSYFSQFTTEYHLSTRSVLWNQSKRIAFLYALVIVSKSLSASSPEGDGWMSSFMQ